MTKTENIGKNAPGPQYAYEDKIKYSDVSEKLIDELKFTQWNGFGTNALLFYQPPRQAFSHAVKMPAVKPKYDFYENALFLDDPIQADLNRKGRACAPKIGTEPRVSINN